MEETFPQIRHVILDEVQNFQAQDGDWLRKARTLVRQHSECESSHDYYASDNEEVLEFYSESETEQDNSDTNSVAGLYPEYSICQNDDPGYLWCFMDKAQRISRISSNFDSGIPLRLTQTFNLKKVIRNSKRIFERAIEFLDTRTWRFGGYYYRRNAQLTIGHDFEGEQSEVTYSKGERIACLIGVLGSLLKEGYSKGDIAVLCVTEPLEGNELKQLQEFTLTVDAERNDDDNIVLSTAREYGGLERPVVVIVRESFDSNNNGVMLKRLRYCAFTRGMVKLITLKELSGGRKRKERN